MACALSLSFGIIECTRSNSGFNRISGGIGTAVVGPMDSISN
jgi:hypothetical protein